MLPGRGYCVLQRALLSQYGAKQCDISKGKLKKLRRKQLTRYFTVYLIL